MAKAAEALYRYLLCRDLICENQHDGFCYHIQMILCTVIFYLVVATFGICYHCFLETIIYTTTICTLRRVIGGFHASRFIYCLALSIGCVVISVIYLGQFMEGLTPILLMLFEISGLMIICYLVPPRFVSSLHYSDSELSQICARKKGVIISLLFTHIVISSISGLRLMVYSILGQMTVLLSWVVQDFIERTDKYQ